MSLFSELSCEAGSFSHCLNPHRIFLVRGFEALFPHTGTLGCMVYLTLQLFLLLYSHAKVGTPAPLATALPGLPATCYLHRSSSCCLVMSPVHPGCQSLPLLLVWMNVSFLNSLIVGLPYTLIFWQFWLFIVFKFVDILLLLIQGGKVYLPMPPSCLEV